MSHFKTDQFKIEGESKDDGTIRVVKFETGGEPKVRAYSLPQLDVRGKGNYDAVKGKYGALAATDSDRRSKSPKDSRFSVNPLLRDSLAIEDEERRVIDRRVQGDVRLLAEQARAEGEKRGYEAGLKKGRDEAYEEFGKKASESLESLQSFVKGFESLKSEVFKANERFLMALVFRVARMIALKELSADPEYVLRLSRDLLERMEIRDNVKIRISQKDASAIETLKVGLIKSFPELKNLTIEVSDEVPGGGCAIETQWSAIDASIEMQLQGIQAALTGDTAGEPGGASGPAGGAPEGNEGPKNDP